MERELGIERSFKHWRIEVCENKRKIVIGGMPSDPRAVHSGKTLANIAPGLGVRAQPQRMAPEL